MLKKTIISLLLVFAVIFSLAACGGKTPQPAEPTAAPTEVPSAAPTQEPAPEPTDVPEDPQILLLYQNLKSVQQGDGREWRFAVTDLDHNGLLELVAASQHQADRSTTLKVWELNESKDIRTFCI